MKSNLTKYGDINLAIKKYIEFNVIDRYKIKNVELFVTYKDLRRQNILKYKNSWNKNVTEKLSKIQTETAFDQSSVKVFFNQEKDSALFNYDYFFNISLEKI